ncbi:hypothetical protein MLD38_025308 [Melastoma candidum]|uniref:Uncharacterized protein n=1 Tax=Melastoma candidum TaxID=119954 RepID=A0ACB9NVF1_9MYRT|nr:hypothetical protein MLD38_025308 [Melastoma candidum]
MVGVGVLAPGNRVLAFPYSFVEAQARKPSAAFCCQIQPQTEEEEEEQESDKKIGRYKWVEVTPIATPLQKQAFSKLPFRMTNRCRALLRQIIVRLGDSDPHRLLPSLLTEWVFLMKPARCDWLAVIKQLTLMNHPLHLRVAEFALLEESFEPHIRDYTKLIHAYGKEGRICDAEALLSVMKERGFVVDQVVLTALVHMYGKAGNLELVEKAFGDIRRLGVPIDVRAYGAMVMAYIRAGMLPKGEDLLREMDEHELRGGSEIYKALLRAYTRAADSEGAQRVFDALQIAGIIPDARICGLLVTAYAASGQIERAFAVVENMRKAGIEPNDKCVAAILEAHERENKIMGALNFLLKFERDGLVIGKEASEILARWLRKLGVVEQVKSVLKDYEATEAAVVDHDTLPGGTEDLPMRRGLAVTPTTRGRQSSQRRGNGR